MELNPAGSHGRKRGTGRAVDEEEEEDGGTPRALNREIQNTRKSRKSPKSLKSLKSLKLVESRNHSYNESI